jgi:Holliday junction resolvase RusA-like endonuclease
MKWRGRIVISARGRSYREHVVAALKPLGIRLRGKLGVVVLYSGKCDVDNINKCLLDSLEHAKIYRNDNDIDDLRVLRVYDLQPDVVSVEVREL